MTGNTFENIPEDKRARVLEAAEEEFADHGFHQASMNRVVSRLGIAKGSLFKYFGTKEGLFEHLFRHSMEELKRPLREARALEGGFFDRFQATMLAGLDYIDAHPRLYRIYLKLLFQENTPLRGKLLATVHGSLEEYLRTLLEQGIRNGELRPDLDMNAALFLTRSVMERFFQAARVQGFDERIHDLDREGAEQEARRLIALLKHGLSSNSNTRQSTQ